MVATAKWPNGRSQRLPKTELGVGERNSLEFLEGKKYSQGLHGEALTSSGRESEVRPAANNTSDHRSDVWSPC